MPVDRGYPQLEAWRDFYIAASAAAATLVGLLFVSITLAAERGQPSEAKRISVYLTPTVVYFTSVLLLVVALTFPTQTRLSVALCCSVTGVAGILYALSLLWGGRRRARFYQTSDKWPYSLLPTAAFTLLVVGGVTVYASDGGAGLTMVAAGTLALLGLGLRNSWAIAVTITTATAAPDDPKSRD